MNKIDGQFRQGDVFIEVCDTIPKEAKRLKKGHVNYNILAHGEVTGHAHRLPTIAPVEMYEHDGTLYLKVLEDVDVTHEEHGTIPLPPGNYSTRIQREYTPEAIVNVRD